MFVFSTCRLARLSLIIFLGFLFEVAEIHAAVISQVQVQGNKRIESAAIQSKIQSKAGATLSRAIIRNDIRSVFSLGFFEDIEVLEEDDARGTKLIFKVQEKPIVKAIEYTGLDALDQEDIKDQIQVKEYEVLDYHKVNETIEKLISKYEEKGYYLVDIRYETEKDESRNEVILKFIIEENAKIQVRKINIIGNRVLNDEDLKSVMQTKEGGFFSWLSGSGSYRESLFERDIAALTYYYGTMGYVRARIGKPEVTVSPDKKWISITFSIDEGEQYFVGKIDFSGDLLYSQAELNEGLQLVQGEVFNTETLRRETLRYTDKYSDLGYAFANVVPQPNIHDDTKTVDVNFEVDRGERVFIGKIWVTGNTKTKDKVIRRELRIHEGELFSGSRKRESRDSVMRLGYFDNVEFHQTTSKTAGNVVDIEIRVKERSTGQLVIGAGYATGDLGFSAYAQLSQNNFLGNGQVASLFAQMQTGNNRYEFNISFDEPYLGYSNWSAGSNFYLVRRDVAVSGLNMFSEIKTAATAKFGHPIWEFTNMYLTYKIEHSYVNPSTILDTNLIKPEAVNGYTSSAIASIVFDRRDDRFDPRDGYYWNLATEYAGLGGDRKFLRNTANLRFYRPIFWDFIFRFQANAGHIVQTTETPIAVNDLYSLGGMQTLRGYDYFSIGPRGRLSPLGDIALDEKIRNNANIAGSEITIGGRNQLYSNAEVEFPILKEAKIRGVLFFDAGNAFNDWSTFKKESPMLYTDFGWGFRWFTPIGPLRFEFAYPIIGGSAKFNFTIGPPF